MTTPRTAAGRALLAYLWRVDPNYKDEHLEEVLAIEAEAAALDVERLAQHFPFGTPIGLGCFCGWRSDPYRQLDWWEHVAAAYQQEGEK